MEASEKITAQIDRIKDWRGDTLKQLRKLINETNPDLTEEFKWNVPVWTHNGLVCAISSFKDHVKFNFFKGAYLPDPKKLFNSGLDSKEHRSINFARGDTIDKSALAEIIRSAIRFNAR